MATIQELLDLAYQIRDAEQNGENTALRVGQFLVELVNHFNTKADVDNISGAYHLKQQQAPIMALMSVQQMSDSNGQDNKAWWSTDGHIKYQHNGRIYDLGTPAYMLYYCGDKIYKWTGSATGFKLMTDGGGGSSGGGASVFANFAVAASTNELPDNGVATTGYIVGQNLYAYVGTGGDTHGGKYQDLGELNAAGVSLTTNGDGTFTVHSGGNDYTVNLNHTHPNMAKLIVCEESDLPSTLDNSTIYAITDSGETEIEKLIIRGMEFAGGGVPDTGEPMIVSPSNGSTLNLGDNSAGSGVSKTITVKGKNLTGDLTVAVGTGLTISYGQSTGQSSVTIPMAQALLGAQVTISYSGSGALDDGSLVIRQGNDVLSSVVVVVVVVVVQPLAFWDGADLPSNNKWIDKINNLPINLFGTASHVTNGYQLNNLSDQDAAYALSDAANNAFLNQEIDKEFHAIVDCSIKFGATSRRALVLDFSAFGEAQSGLSANAFILQSGMMRSTFKKNGNNVIDGSALEAQTDITFPVGTYVDVTIEIGARILQSGKQELYVRAGNAINSKTIDTPVAVSFAGTQENSGAFALGVGYFAGNNNTLNAYASDAFADVIYKSIKIYKS